MPGQRSVRLWLVRRDASGDYTLVERGTVTAVPALEPVPVSSRFTKRTLRGATFLDAFLAREPDGPWFSARDEDAFESLQEWAVAVQPSAEALRAANHGVCLGVLARAGIVLHPSELPGWPQ